MPPPLADPAQHPASGQQGEATQNVERAGDGYKYKYIIYLKL